MNVDGSGKKNLSNHSGDDSKANWLPDGKKITFTNNRDGNEEIYIMNADGANQVRVTCNEAQDKGSSWRPQPLVDSNNIAEAEL